MSPNVTETNNTNTYLKKLNLFGTCKKAQITENISANVIKYQKVHSKYD